MKQGATAKTPWRRLLGCASWPVLIPVALWFQTIREMQAGLSSPDVRSVSDARASLTEKWVVRFAAPEVLLCLALALLACWVVHRRLFGPPLSLGFRVVTDVAVVVGFAVAPWIAWVGILGEPGGYTVLDAWMMPGLFYRAIPCICAVLAVASCLILGWKERDAHEVAAA